MDKLTNAFLQVRNIEDLAKHTSLLHQLHPLLKMIGCLLFIIAVLTTSYYDIFELGIYFIIIIILALVGKIKIKSILKRSLVGIPLSLCLGVSNIFLLNTPILVFGFTVRLGYLACFVILLKTILCLSIVFLLIASTSFDQIGSELVHVKVPPILVLQLVMTYRYIFVLFEQARNMTQAYLLRNPSQTSIAFKDMGSFVGSLLIRSFKQSNDVYDCMRCRGFNIKTTYTKYQTFAIENYFLLMMYVAVILLIKVVF